MEPEQQAEWFAGSGYLPVRNSSYDLPAAQDIMAKYPEFRVPVDALPGIAGHAGHPRPPAGALHRGAGGHASAAWRRSLVGDKDPIEALNDAAEESNQIIEDYNQRVE